MTGIDNIEIKKIETSIVENIQCLSKEELQDVFHWVDHDTLRMIYIKILEHKLCSLNAVNKVDQIEKAT